MACVSIRGFPKSPVSRHAASRNMLALPDAYRQARALYNVMVFVANGGDQIP